MNKKSGFTLAEVLVTLMIIGVVAAMTVPTLMNSTRNQEYVTGARKAYSTISQAVAAFWALEGRAPKCTEIIGSDDDAAIRLDGNVAKDGFTYECQGDEQIKVDVDGGNRGAGAEGTAESIGDVHIFKISGTKGEGVTFDGAGTLQAINFGKAKRKSE